MYINTMKIIPFLMVRKMNAKQLFCTYNWSLVLNRNHEVMLNMLEHYFLAVFKQIFVNF